jgi:uncharacterized protein
MMEKKEVVITQLHWDDWNLAHIARHGVVPEEVEQSLKDEMALFLKARQGRVMVLGRAGARLIATVLNEQETEGLFYVITARDMSKKERAYYRTQKGFTDE